MKFRLLMGLAWVLIVSLTVYAVYALGPNWPAVAINDLINHPWRSQFDTDFLIHLLLFGSWIYWREGGGLKAGVFAFLSVIAGGLFSFPYLLVESYRAKGDMQALLLGDHYSQ